MNQVLSICPYCGVGCGLRLEVINGLIVRTVPDPSHIVSKGHICGKGSLAHESIYSWDRVLYPLKREKGVFLRTTWQETIKEISHKLLEIKAKYGENSIGFYGGCQNTLEEVYSFMKLARALGTNNVDSCARVCHEPSAIALKEMVGIGASATSVTEIPKSKVLVVSGESITDSHPVISQYLVQLKKNGGKLVVIDPRVTGTAKIADLHLQINPGTDIFLYNAVANYLINNNLIDQKFIEDRVENFEEFKKAVSNYSIDEAEKVTGVEKEKITEFSKLISQKPVIFSWGLGLTQSGGAGAVKAYINLALLTGNIGLEGSGLIVYRGQSNVQGSGDLIKPNVFPNGKMNEDNANELMKIWGFKPPTWKGKTVTEALLDGGLKALILMNFNLAISLPNRKKVEKILDSLELLVVIDSFLTETAKHAHYVLPSAMWAEKEGSVTSLDRLVKWRFKAVDPPGEAKSELEILSMLANSLGFKNFSSDPKKVFLEMKEVVKTYSNLNLNEVMDYNKPSRYPANDTVLYRDRFLTPSGKAKLAVVKEKNFEKGIILITGRTVTRYNTDELINRTPGFNKYEPSLMMNPKDAEKLGIKNGDLVKVYSRCGKVVLPVTLTNEVKEGTVFSYMHNPDINYVVCDDLDEESKAPRYKYTVVNIEKAN
ncbi:MAG: formate dehydrogenase subunit alpha [Sulfolobus sp.]|nr:formate dehydrogenase subunit alpha [Sulfolobus sp.]